MRNANISVLAEEVAIVALATDSILDEFAILFESFTLFHGAGFRWYVGCNPSSRTALERYPGVSPIVLPEQASIPSPAGFRSLMKEKSRLIDHAWQEKAWKAILYLDSDIVVMAPFLEFAMALGGDVVLTPHYYGAFLRSEEKRYGKYNAGFVLCKTRHFASWWREMILRHPTAYFDQGVLDYAPEVFEVVQLDERANVGLWRRSHSWSTPAIPRGCFFVHVHLYLDMRPMSQHDLLHKTFALECLQFLRNSEIEAHHYLSEVIMSHDTVDYYGSILDGQVAIVTHCESVRAVRAILMARSVPRQLSVICLAVGPEGPFLDRIGKNDIPDNLRVVYKSRQLDWKLISCNLPVRWAILTDIDYVFPEGFAFRLLSARARLDGECAIACGAVFADQYGSYVNKPTKDILSTETVASHVAPRSWPELVSATSATVDLSLVTSTAARTELRSRRPHIRAIPPVLVPISAGTCNYSRMQLYAVNDTFSFHLWHPPEEETSCTAWAATILRVRDS